jgi:hypothetical protein
LDNVKAKTGLTPDDFRRLARQKGLVNAREILAWLKEDYGLGYGHAGAIYYTIAHADDARASTDDRIEKLFNKAKWCGATRRSTTRFANLAQTSK